MQALIEHYGYLAVLIGTLLEGETILILGGFLAHRGYLHLGGVMLAALVGTLIGDQLFFQLGRRRGQGFLGRRPQWAARIARITPLLEGHATLIMLGFRFWYGVRTVIPFAIGLSSIDARRFALLNIVGAAV